MLTCWSVGVVCQKHDVMARGPWIYNICATPYIIRREVKAAQLMMIDTVVLEKDDLAGVAMTVRTISICGPGHTYRLILGLFLKYFLNSRK